MPENISTEATVVDVADTAPDASATADSSPTASGAPAAPAKEKRDSDGLTAAERAELERLRAIHQDEQKWEKRNKANLAKLRDLAESMGIPREVFNPAEFDPKSAFEQLQQKFETAERERNRAEVARELDVPPKYVMGETIEEMRESAQDYLKDVQSLIDAALKKATVPATESTAIVKSGDRVEGPKQITSEAELKKLSPAERLAAYKDGRLDKLLGRN